MVLFIEYQTDNILSFFVTNPAFVFSNFYCVFPTQVKSRVAHVTITSPQIM